MTPSDEARFIALWQAGTEQAAMAQALGIPRGTVKSRAHTLACQGKIEPRPRGGAYPRQQARQRLEHLPPQINAGDDMHSPVHTVQTVQAQIYALHGAAHNDLSLEDRKSERWNIYMPRWLRQIVEAEAEATRLSPSQVLQDVVKAWVERRSAAL